MKTKIIRSEKHKGALFIKRENTHKDFVCKIYPYPNGNERAEELAAIQEALEQL